MYIHINFILNTVTGYHNHNHLSDKIINVVLSYSMPIIC